MSTYEDKKKLMPLYPKGTKVLVEIESIKDPKLSPFKIVTNIFLKLYQYYLINHIGNRIKFNSK